MTRARVRVALADDHEIFRDGLRGLLESEPLIDVVGEAADGHAAAREVEGHLVHLRVPPLHAQLLVEVDMREDRHVQRASTASARALASADCAISRSTILPTPS